MIKRLVIVISFPFFLFSSCVQESKESKVALTRTIMNATTIFLQIENSIDCDDLEVKLDHGSVDTTNSCVYKINYKFAAGGAKILHNERKNTREVIEDRSPQLTNILTLSKDSIEIRRISYHEIIKLDFKEKDGEKIYQLKIE